MKNPIILSENTHDLADLDDLKNSNKIWSISDYYKEQLEELFFILNPSAKISVNSQQLLQVFIQQRIKTSEGKFVGSWVYYPWNGQLVHVLGADDFFIVRTNRNKNIITTDEQSKLYKFKIAILGLSIGNGMALSLAYSGISEKMILADHDTLELSNLNRIRTGVDDLGLSKIEITCKQIYEINPYAELELFDKGVNGKNINDFINGKVKPELIFEAIDDFEMKIKIRIEAKKAHIPIIMLTNLGDRLLIDIERYDLDPNLVMFNGLIGDVAEEILNNPILEQDKQRYAIAIVGKENITKRVLDSVMEVNKTLVGRPQVMSMVTIGGGVAAYLARRLVVGPVLSSGRYIIDFESQIK
jgi:hypothetical protein